ncbi:uncharacterized protein J3R85_003982 [Psidium guajava]|nr:uncharacterized protein J3R85_003982 [Psidium guajava]
MEVAVLKQEKEILSSTERRVRAEVQSLSERIYHLQATLDTIRSAEEVHEEARAMEKKRQIGEERRAAIITAKGENQVAKPISEATVAIGRGT